MQKRPEIIFYYDVVSPYSYFAFETLCKYRDIWNINVTLKPVSLGAIMQITGNRPPASNPVKGKYLGKDLKRSAALCHLEMKIPLTCTFPTNTMKAQRVLTHLSIHSPDLVEQMSRAFWQMYWVKDEDIGQEDVILKVLSQIPALLSSATLDFLIKVTEQDEQVKLMLKKNTEEAINHGAFGAPTLVVIHGAKKEMFFGSDRFEHIAHYLDKPWKGYHPAATKL